MKYQIKANKELFNAWGKLLFNLRDMKAIVQNDIELDEQALRDFARFFKEHRAEELEVFHRTVKYIKKNDQN
jgi:ferritin